MKKLNSSFFKKDEIIGKEKYNGLLGGAISSDKTNDSSGPGITDKIYWTIWDVVETSTSDDTIK